MDNELYYARRSPKTRLRATAAVMLALSLGACQSAAVPGISGLGQGQKQAQTKTEPEKIDIAKLDIYCPRITLRSGTAFFNTYEKGGEDDPDRIIYQASVTDVTRGCTPGDDTVAINAALAGRIVPGPKGKPGTITMPIRVAVVRGEEVIYSKLHKYDVEIGSEAKTFVFNDPDIIIPTPDARNVQIFIGYDEGPYDTP